jgi:hypothetical protein
MKAYCLLRIPEVSLCFLSFFLNFFWEVVQTYFYTLKDSPFRAMLYGWIHCTLSDVVITLGAFWFIGILNHSRKWFLTLNTVNLIGFVMIGIFYTLFSEWLNVHIIKSWAYSDLMPIIPWMKVGLTPLLQWMIIPPLAILVVRHHFLLNQEGAERKED